VFVTGCAGFLKIAGFSFYKTEFMLLFFFVDPRNRKSPMIERSEAARFSSLAGPRRFGAGPVSPSARAFRDGCEIFLAATH